MGVVERHLSVSRFDVYLINLDPTLGSEIRKTRPCLIISPNEINRTIATFIVAPMTTVSKPYPTRISCTFQGKNGFIVLDQIRTVDKTRLVKKLGKIDVTIQQHVLDVLAQLFAE